MSEEYVRYQAAFANRDGGRTGIFGLVNGLGRAGLLTPSQEHARRTGNNWYDANFRNPTTLDPAAYDLPGAAAWFAVGARYLLERIPPYLAILDDHGVPYEIVRTRDPGRIVYRDEHQVIAVPDQTPPGNATDMSQRNVAG